MKTSDSKSDVKLKHQVKSRNIGSQTQYREQSAQTKPYLPNIHCHPGTKEFEIFQTKYSGYNRVQNAHKRQEYEKIIAQANKKDTENISNIFEWEEWLQHEEDLEETQSIRLKFVEEMLEKRGEIFERDSSNTLDKSIIQLSREHQAKIAKIR